MPASVDDHEPGLIGCGTEAAFERVIMFYVQKNLEYGFLHSYRTLVCPHCDVVSVGSMLESGKR